MTQCAPCGPVNVIPCSGFVAIIQGYQKTYFFNLFYSGTGAPYDLTGALQIIASHPGAEPNTPVNEYLTAQTVLETTGNTAASSNQLTGLASVVGIAEGQTVTGTGIPAATTVLNVSGTTVTLSANATASNTGTAVTFSTATNVTVVGSPGAGVCRVYLPPYDSALLQLNPSIPQFQDLQISVTNADGSVTGFIMPNVLNIIAPPFGVV